MHEVEDQDVEVPSQSRQPGQIICAGNVSSV